jgi:uncharacterized protein involved in exopolysaccharide biosynthesis
MSPHPDENTWSDYMAMLRRRWRPTLVVVAIIALGSIYIAYTLPAVYESSATVLIEEQGIPEDLVTTTVNAYAEQLLQTILQRVLAAPRIVEMIDSFDLYAAERASVPEDELILLFRDSVSMKPQNVTSVHSRTGREAIITFGFQISFQYSDPIKARDVTRRLADTFVAENALLRGEAASRATEFFGSEADDIQSQLDDIAQRIAQFKERHANNLPEDQGVNLRTWERLEEELRQTQTRIREVEESKSLMETEIADVPRYRPVLDDSGDPVLGGVDRLSEAQQELIRLQGRYSDSHPDIIALKREIAALSASPTNLANLAEEVQTELGIRRQELAAARQAYSESHPDVVRLRDTVNSLASQLSDLERQIATSSLSGASQPNNPVYLQLRTRIRTAEAELRELRNRRSELTGRIAEYDRRMATAPQVERDYTALTQERDVLLERYRELRDKEGAADRAEALEKGNFAERLNIIEPPRVPSNPVSPNRMSLSFLGIVLSLALGLGTASLTEAMDTKVRGRRDVYQLLDAPPMGVIPYVESTYDRVKRLTINSVMALGLVGAVALVATTVVS